jgi:hypothetical protein
LPPLAPSFIPAPLLYEWSLHWPPAQLLALIPPPRC